MAGFCVCSGRLWVLSNAGT